MRIEEISLKGELGKIKKPVPFQWMITNKGWEK